VVARQVTTPRCCPLRTPTQAGSLCYFTPSRFKKYPSCYDPSDIGVDTPGAVKALVLIVDLINEGVLPRGASYTVMEQKMISGELATMISGPSAWHKLRKYGIDFGVAPIPGIDGSPGRPFVDRSQTRHDAQS
jgi:maltose-binding protein MalE